jgi:hypothetical protein
MHLPRLYGPNASPDPLELVVLCACSYEAVSIATGKKLPPISYMCWRFPALSFVILGGLGLHFHRPSPQYRERYAPGI